jgi:hypothetical protein
MIDQVRGWWWRDTWAYGHAQNFPFLRLDFWNKIEPLTEEERLERAHLEACQDAWRLLHWPEDVERDRIEREVYGWTTADTKRHRELLLTGWRDTGLLTPEERSEFAALEARCHRGSRTSPSYFHRNIEEQRTPNKKTVIDRGGREMRSGFSRALGIGTA